MKILIGTPVHISKDYCMERWLKNVAKLTHEHPADFLMVDNSPGTGYVEKVKCYCTKYSIKNHRIKHIELPLDQEKFERVARSREVIRQEILSKSYDAWFSWECDQIIPTNALDKLVNILQAGDFMMVNHNSWAREISDSPNYDWGIALISRKALEKYSFILEFGTDPDMPEDWEPGENWFKKRVLRGGDGFLEVDGVIKPIYHLNK